VSANPTGYLHIGNARNAVLGDCLVKIFRFLGYDVTTKYYVNDCGTQIHLLGLTVFMNYLSLLTDFKIMNDDNLYKGKVYEELAQQMIQKYSNQFVNSEFDEKQIKTESVRNLFERFAVDFFVKELQKDLLLFKVKIDDYFFESSITKTEINNIITMLQEKDAIYKSEGALFVKTSVYSDEKDRVFLRSNNERTYFGNDLVYHHLRILSSKANRLINIVASDHHGYVQRINSGLQLLG
jgi:arginyl-tRNA synthetase